MIQILLILLITGIGIYTIYSLTNNTIPQPTTTSQTTTTSQLPALELFYTGITTDTIKLPIRDINSVITIDWGDKKIETFNTNNPGHTYNLNNLSDITIKVSGGSFNTFSNNSFTALLGIDKLTKVNSWGDYKFTSMNRAFYFASNLIYVPNTIPSGVTNLNYAFSNAHKFNGDISKWDTSSVTNMSYMFYSTFAFNSDISKWDTNNVTDMESMFNNAFAFNGDISKWNTSKVTNMNFIFSDATVFTQDIGEWNISNMIQNFGMFGSNNSTRPKLSIENYTKLIKGWVKTAKSNSSGGLSLDVITNRDGVGSAELYESARGAYDTLKGKGWSITPEPSFISDPTTTGDGFTNIEKMSNKKLNGYSNSKLLHYAKYIK